MWQKYTVKLKGELIYFFQKINYMLFAVFAHKTNDDLIENCAIFYIIKAPYSLLGIYKSDAFQQIFVNRQN